MEIMPIPFIKEGENNKGNVAHHQWVFKNTLVPTEVLIHLYHRHEQKEMKTLIVTEERITKYLK